ncbi:MAG TPA: hypothetical protein VFZ85_05090 [Jiangellaceae bacterium]
MTAPRSTTLAALFVAGTIAGAGGVALASSAAGSPPSLATGPLLSSDYELSAEGLVTLAVDVFNSSEQDVPVVVKSVAGWQVSGSEPDSEVLPARTWTRLEITTMPDCDAVITEVMTLDAGSYSLDVPLEHGIPQMLRRLHDEFCGLDPYVFATMEVASATADDQGLGMSLRLLGHGREPLGDLQITDTRPSLSGSTFRVTNLPVTLAVEGSTMLDAHWTVDDCTVALQAIVRPAVTFVTEERVVIEAPLDDRGVALLARYIANVCTP